jgi:hypothetical protein
MNDKTESFDACWAGCDERLGQYAPGHSGCLVGDSERFAPGQACIGTEPRARVYGCRRGRQRRCGRRAKGQDGGRHDQEHRHRGSWCPRFPSVEIDSFNKDDEGIIGDRASKAAPSAAFSRNGESRCARPARTL